MYRADVVVKAPVSVVRKLAVDPFIVAGVSGHISIIGIKDKEKNEYVLGDELAKPENEFAVVYLLRTSMSERNYKPVLGIFKGPEISIEGIKYYGYTNDHKLEFEIGILPRSLGENLTRIFFTVKVKYNDSLLDKLLGRTDADFAKHVVDDHFITYAKHYFNFNVENGNSLPKFLVFSYSGNIKLILKKVNEIVSQLDLGVIKIDVGKVKCSVIVKEKEIKEAVCKSSEGEEIDFNQLSNLNVEGKLEVYRINIGELVENLVHF